MKAILRMIPAMFVAAAALLVASSAQSQSFPTRPVTIVTLVPPGGVIDWMSRTMAANLQEVWKQPVVVENKPGGGGKIANEAVIRAPHDGYTLLASTSIAAASQVFEKDKSIDFEKQFAPLTTMLYAPYVIIIPTALPMTTLGEYIAYAKANPGKLNFAGATNSGQMLEEYSLFQRTGVNVTIIPYAGGAPALRALIANEVQGYFGAAFGLQEQVRGGRIRALAVTSAKRFSPIPDVPTVKESIGLDFVAGVYYGFFGAAGTPPDVLAKIAADMMSIAKRPDIQAQVMSRTYEAPVLTPAEFAQLVSKEARHAEETARFAHIQPQ